MNKLIYVVPNKGVQFRDPKTMQIVPSEGVYVAPSMFWNRRARDNDVVIYPSKPETPEPISGATN